MSQANGAPPANDRERSENEVSWRDDPSLQAWSRSGAGGRRPLPVGVPSAVGGLRADEVAVVLVDGRQLVVPIPRAVALASGYTVLDPDPQLLRAAGVVLDEPPVEDEAPEPLPVEAPAATVEAAPVEAVPVEDVTVDDVELADDPVADDRIDVAAPEIEAAALPAHEPVAVAEPELLAEPEIVPEPEMLPDQVAAQPEPEVAAEPEPVAGTGTDAVTPPADQDDPPLPEWPVLEEWPAAVAVPEAVAEPAVHVDPETAPVEPLSQAPVAEAPPAPVPLWPLPGDTPDALVPIEPDADAGLSDAPAVDEPADWTWPTGVRTVGESTPTSPPLVDADPSGWPAPAAPPRLVIGRTTPDPVAEPVPVAEQVAATDLWEADPWAAAPATSAERPQPIWALPGDEDVALPADQLLEPTTDSDPAAGPVPDEPIFPFIDTDVAVKMSRPVPTENDEGVPAVREHPVGIPLELLDGTLSKWDGPDPITWEPPVLPAPAIDAAPPVPIDEPAIDPFATVLAGDTSTDTQEHPPSSVGSAPQQHDADQQVVEPVLRSSRLRARSITRRLRGPAGEITVLDALDLEAAPAELLVIRAAAGAGASTLLACLAGIDDVDSGEVEVDGRPLASLSDAERAHHRGGAGGFVPQENDLVELFTVGENVELPLLSAGWSTQDARGEVARVLALLGLSGHQTFRPGQLSGSQRRCALVARAVAGSPLLILADHPTAYLDDVQADQVISAILECRDRGASVVLVSRDPRVLHRADRVLLLADGRLSAVDGPPVA